MEHIYTIYSNDNIVLVKYFGLLLGYSFSGGLNLN